jgi:hypothetical protein
MAGRIKELIDTIVDKRAEVTVTIANLTNPNSHERHHPENLAVILLTIRRSLKNW